MRARASCAQQCLRASSTKGRIYRQPYGLHRWSLGSSLILSPRNIDGFAQTTYSPFPLFSRLILILNCLIPYCVVTLPLVSTYLHTHLTTPLAPQLTHTHTHAPTYTHVHTHTHTHAHTQTYILKAGCIGRAAPIAFSI